MSVYFDYVVRGRLVAPDGSKLNEAETAIILPDGKQIKVWEAFELGDEANDDYHNLTYDELEKMELFFDGDTNDLDGPFELTDGQTVWS